jgi:hypothetical protein
MALQIPQPPDKSRQALQQGLQRLPESRVRSFAVGLVGGAPEISQPHQVFSMGLQDLAAGGGLDSAKSTGWRYLVTPAAPTGESRAVAAADVNEMGGSHQFAQWHEGWISEATHKAIEAAKQLPQVATGSYELRTLRLPALLLDALWLKDTTGNTDLIIPIASMESDVKAGKVYAAPDFLERIRAIARKKPSFDDRPKTASL